MFTKNNYFGKRFPLLLMCLCHFWAQGKTNDFLSIAETIAMSQSPGLIHFEPDAWRGNPDARDAIYKNYRENEQGGQETRISYIGIIGDESDVPKLLSFLPNGNEGAVALVETRIASGVFAALAHLSNRGFKEAGDTLCDMTNPQYWKEKKCGLEGYLDPYFEAARIALFTYPFAGRDDFYQRLESLLNAMDDSKRRASLKANMRDRYESVVKREKEMGTWKVRGRPTILKPRFATTPKSKKTQEEQFLKNCARHAIDNLLTNPQLVSLENNDMHALSNTAEEILVKVKEKKRDEGMFKEIAFLGLFPEITEVNTIVEYIDSLPKILTDADRKLLAACLFSLSMLADNGNGQAQKVLFTYTEEPSYWPGQNINVYGGAEAPSDSLTSSNALILASFVGYSYWRLDHKTPKKVAEYLKYMGVQGAQRQIMEDALLIGVLNHVRFYEPNLEARTKSRYGEWMFKWRIFDLILKMLTPPLTHEKLISPPE